MVDNTLNISDMLRCHCIRYLAIREIVYSHTIQIHCANAVIIGSITAIFTTEGMLLFISVCFFSVTTNRTSLTCVVRIDIDDRTFIQSSFILNLLFKVIKRP